MTNNVSSARRYREIVRPRTVPKTNEASTHSEADINLREFLESEYEKEKSKLLQLITEGASETVIKSESFFLFLISVGLFTFGRLDVYQDILDNIPHTLIRFKGLSYVITTLLPTPDNLDPLKNTAEIVEWIKTKRSKLKWDESVEKYILENFIILPVIPSNSNPEQFSYMDKKIYQEGVVVEIIPDKSSNWLANFQPGQSEFSGVYQHPNQNDLIIISRGQGYIINPENRELLESFGGCISEVINLSDFSCIFFVDDFRLLCYTSSGFLWQNIEISWNRVRKFKIKDYIFTGEFYSSKDECWQMFWLNTKTEEFNMGEFKWEYLLPKPERPWWQFW
jgi:hypothetical protein